MRQSLAVWLAAALIPLTVSACESVVDAVPVAEPNAGAASSTYVPEFSAMHSAIPMGAGSDVEEYQ
jgi:hypothetical protein